MRILEGCTGMELAENLFSTRVGERANFIGRWGEVSALRKQSHFSFSGWRKNRNTSSLDGKLPVTTSDSWARLRIARFAPKNVSQSWRRASRAEVNVYSSCFIFLSLVSVWDLRYGSVSMEARPTTYTRLGLGIK